MVPRKCQDATLVPVFPYIDHGFEVAPEPELHFAKPDIASYVRIAPSVGLHPAIRILPVMVRFPAISIFPVTELSHTTVVLPSRRVVPFTWNFAVGADVPIPISPLLIPYIQLPILSWFEFVGLGTVVLYPIEILF